MFIAVSFIGNQLFNTLLFLLHMFLSSGGCCHISTSENIGALKLCKFKSATTTT